MENGYHLYDFRGELLREESIDKFKQWSWRPRPASLLTKEEQKQVRKNLHQYSEQFEQDDADLASSADQAVVSERRRILDEWHVWRDEVRTAALAAAGGLVAGAATVAVVRASRGSSGRRAAKRSRGRERPVKVVASRSFLVDVHLLGEK